MGEPIHGKLNSLQVNLPEGLLVDAKWLQEHGYSSALRAKYTAHGWLEQVARSVYRRPPHKLPVPNNNEPLRWQYVVISLRMLLNRPYAIGGRSALELQGFAHYLTPVGINEVHLYGTKNPPGWISRLKLDAHLIFHKTAKLFTDPGVPSEMPPNTSSSTEGKADSGSARAGFIRQPWGHWQWPLILSSPERAVLELLDEVPQRETFHQADVLIEGLHNLSPRRLHSLLLQCRSVKVKRLFLWFAERHNQPWLKGLDQSDLDLGHGKRMLVRSGKLDTKYNITVPETLDGGD